MAGVDVGSSSHKDCRASRIKAREATVGNILQTLSSWSDPFLVSEEDDSLINISSGVLVPEAVKSDLLNAEAIGEKRFLQFVNNRLKSNKEKFHDPISKLQLKTFTKEEIKSERAGNNDKGRPQPDGQDACGCTSKGLGLAVSSKS